MLKVRKHCIIRSHPSTANKWSVLESAEICSHMNHDMTLTENSQTELKRKCTLVEGNLFKRLKSLVNASKIHPLLAITTAFAIAAATTK